MWRHSDTQLSQCLPEFLVKLRCYLPKLYRGKKGQKTTLSQPSDQNEKICQKNNQERPVLIFSCHSGQSFWLNKNIQVIVFATNKGMLRVGIKAPPEFCIRWEEALDQGALHE